MYKKTIVHHIAKWAIEIGFYLGIIGTVLSLFITDDVMHYFNYNVGEELIYTIALFVSGVLAVYLLYNIKRMYKSLFSASSFPA